MPATTLPDEPSLPDTPRGQARVALRYEDVLQDGRLALGAVPQALGEAVWRALLSVHPASAKMRDDGIVPILARLMIVGTDGPCSVDHPLDASGCYEVAASHDASGAVERLHLNMWGALDGPRARTHDPQPSRAGERQRVARIFAEHVFTRPFAPPAERKVVRLALPGLPELPAARYATRALTALFAPPAAAIALDAEPTAEPTPHVFGIAHTDSNQHVNSLVYPRLFEEAAVRRLAEHGAPPTLAREVELLYRKPSFAGERLVIVLRAYRDGAGYLVTGAFYPPSALATATSLAAARPHCAVRMRLG